MIENLDVQDQEIVKALRAGKTVDEVAEEVGVSVEKVESLVSVAEESEDEGATGAPEGGDDSGSEGVTDQNAEKPLSEDEKNLGEDKPKPEDGSGESAEGTNVGEEVGTTNKPEGTE